MDPETIKAIAKELFNQAFLQNWRFDLLLIAAWAVTASISSYLGAYFAKRAEHKANEADFKSIKDQLRETTSLTEGIRAEVQSMSDRAHILENLKREKLEQYLVTIQEAVEYVNEQMNHFYFGTDKPKGFPPTFKSNMIQTMYLPELSNEHSDFVNAMSEFGNWIVAGMEEQVAMMVDGGEKKPPGQKHLDKYNSMHQSINNAIQIIYGKVREISKGLR